MTSLGAGTSRSEVCATLVRPGQGFKSWDDMIIVPVLPLSEHVPHIVSAEPLLIVVILSLLGVVAVLLILVVIRVRELLVILELGQERGRSAGLEELLNGKTEPVKDSN